MNLEQLNDEELRIEVARLLGWSKRTGGGYWLPDSPRRLPGATVDSLPDWPRDLNACHEMEKTLSEGQRQDYCAALEQIIFGLSEIHWSSDQFWTIHATARIRCEAFVAALRKKQQG